jgi:hypothetical protein
LAEEMGPLEKSMFASPVNVIVVGYILICLEENVVTLTRDTR